MADKVNLKEKKYFNQRKASMEKERTSFMSHWQDLSKFGQPRRGRFLVTDVNKGDKKFTSIINSRGTIALRTASAGMVAGVMSPSRPWHKLGTFDPDMMKFKPVKSWLELAELTMREIFNAGNLYKMAPTMMSELLLFATGSMSQVDDFSDISRFFTHTIGSYSIAQNERLEVDTYCREYERTVAQIVGEFSYKNASKVIQDHYDRGEYDVKYTIVHYVEPNPFYKEGSPFSKHALFRSVKYELGDVNKAASEKGYIKEAGFKRFPFMIPRWETTAEDIYGSNCPGMIALGDIKQLQTQEKRKAQGIDKQVNPPLTGPASLKNVPITALPGGINLYDGDPNGNTLKPIYEVKPDIGALSQDMDRVEARINEIFFVDLFMAISNMRGIQPKNEMELAERNAERLLQLGPVLESIHGEFLNILIDNTFDRMIELEMLPPPPQELQGQPLKITYISTLAKAQKSVETGGIEQVAGFVSALVQGGKEEALDKFDADAAIDVYSNAVGTPPAIIRSQEEVDLIREARQKQIQQQQQLEQANLASETAGNLAGADLEGDNALQRVAANG